MGWSKLFKIIYTKEKILCSYCKKHEARWEREQIINGECYQYHLCQYHKNMRVRAIGLVSKEKKWRKEKLVERR